METTDDIIRRIREDMPQKMEGFCNGELVVLDLPKLADRLEAAIKREIEDAVVATVKAAAKSASEVYEPHIQSEHVGNGAKMRKALERIHMHLRAYVRHEILEESLCLRIKNEINKALAEPPCESVTDCNALNAEKAYEVVAKWRHHLEFKFTNGFGNDTAADIGRDMLACLDEIKQSIPAPSDKKTAENVNSDAAIGNTAKIREALEVFVKVCEEGSNVDIEMLAYAYKKAKAALSEPPRNCDLLANAQTALAAIHDDRGYVQSPIDERELTVKWLLAEAKGECNESKFQPDDARGT